MPTNRNEVIAFLDEHHRSFFSLEPYATKTGHTTPSDTKSSSEVLVSLLTGIKGRERQKGSDFADGSDVKAANVWEAIDTPRFNGCAPAGRVSATSRKAENLSAFGDIPYMFFVLWDYAGSGHRCRVWVVRTQHDPEFRRVVGEWYRRRGTGQIKSTNFQLHPPRNQNHDVIRNTCGNLSYPLLFRADNYGSGYTVVTDMPEALTSGLCKPAP